MFNLQLPVTVSDRWFLQAISELNLLIIKCTYQTKVNSSLTYTTVTKVLNL
jgi:hypothetical protein